MARARSQVTPFRYYGNAARAAVKLLRSLARSRRRFVTHSDFTNLLFVDRQLDNYDQRRGYSRATKTTEAAW
jgi:hypothetical protein